MDKLRQERPHGIGNEAILHGHGDMGGAEVGVAGSRMRMECSRRLRSCMRGVERLFQGRSKYYNNMLFLASSGTYYFSVSAHSDLVIEY